LSRLDRALRALDEAHGGDPVRESVGGREWPRELLYAERMTQWVGRLAPEASDALRLAARAQHLRRWEIPRRDYPGGRRGYLRWRTRLYGHQAKCAASILRDAGHDETTIGRVCAMLRKEGLRRDPEAQLLEDAACLVFLEHDLPGFAREHEPDKVVDVLRKTWLKMSPAAHRAALALPLAAEERTLVRRALAQP